MNKLTGIASVALAILLAGCATTGAVDQKVAESQAQTNQKIESVEGQIEELQEAHTETEQRLTQVSLAAQEALKRAREAGVLTKGEVSFEQSFSEDRIKFDTNSAELDDNAKAALDEFAAKVKALQVPWYLEVQGHTDDSGTEWANEVLGQRRADSVRRYLSQQHKLPLSRISTISYADTLPVESNATPEGKAANRRVVIVVLE
jgi:outer membrane protein OmpA-like peptidoglycan-associated protein